MSGIDASALADGLRELLTRARLVTWLDPRREATASTHHHLLFVKDEGKGASSSYAPPLNTRRTDAL